MFQKINRIHCIILNKSYKLLLVTNNTTLNISLPDLIESKFLKNSNLVSAKIALTA